MVFRDYIINNLWLKLFSFFAAVLLWFWIDSLQHDAHISPNTFINFARRQSIPYSVQVLTPPGDARVFKVVPDRVYVTITGESAVLSEMPLKEIKVYVDLTDLRINENDGRKVILHVPKDVTVVGIDPPFVKVEQVSP